MQPYLLTDLVSRTIRQLLNQRFAAMIVTVAFSFSVTADDHGWAPQQAIGSTFPDIVATSLDGQPLALGEYKGETGTLLFFNRSTDW